MISGSPVGRSHSLVSSTVGGPIAATEDNIYIIVIEPISQANNTSAVGMTETIVSMV